MIALMILALAESPQIRETEGPFPQTCSFSDVSTPVEDGAEEVLCTMRYTSTPEGLRYTFRFGGRSVVVETDSERVNGLWRAAKIDGKPAVVRELWRGSHIAVTSDMRLAFEWRDRDGGRFPVN